MKLIICSSVVCLGDHLKIHKYTSKIGTTSSRGFDIRVFFVYLACLDAAVCCCEGGIGLTLHRLGGGRVMV